MNTIAILIALHVSQNAGVESDWGNVVERYDAPVAVPIEGGSPSGERIEILIADEVVSAAEAETPAESAPDSLDAPVLNSSAAPNPFNPRTVIRFELPDEAAISLVIFNGRGERVRSLWNGVLPRGPQAQKWDGRDDRGRPVSSGVYFYRLVVRDAVETRRLVLLR